MELVTVVVVRLERKVEAVVVQMDHLEDLGNIDVSENLLEVPLDVEYYVFLVGSVINKYVNDLRSIPAVKTRRA